VKCAPCNERVLSAVTGLSDFGKLANIKNTEIYARIADSTELKQQYQAEYSALTTRRQQSIGVPTHVLSSLSCNDTATSSGLGWLATLHCWRGSKWAASADVVAALDAHMQE
jgi:hypothetical protein